MTVNKGLLLFVLGNDPNLKDEDVITSIKVGEKNVEILGKSYDLQGEKEINYYIPLSRFKDRFEAVETEEGFKTTVE